MPASRSNDIDYVLPDQRRQAGKGEKAPKAESIPQFNSMEIPDQIGYAILPPSCKSAYDIFSLFFSDDVLETIAKNTNQNANDNRVGPKLPKARQWIDTTVEELKAFLAVWIMIGLYPIPKIEHYWNEQDEIRPTFKTIRQRISRNRWAQIDRYFHISPPNHAAATKLRPFTKVYPLDDQLRAASRRYWKAGRNLAVDEAIQQFQGRASEIVNIPSKPTPKGFKIWILAEDGYSLDWMYHSKGGSATDGPYDLDTYWLQPQNGGFAPTQAVVLDLLLQGDQDGKRYLEPGKHVVWTDNLFSTVQLFATLRTLGIGAAGTVRTQKTRREELLDRLNENRDEIREKQPISTVNPNRPKNSPPTIPSKEAYDPFLMSLRTYWEDVIPLGEKYGKLSKNRDVLELAWRDNRMV
jgi:hypothetical protein